MAPRALGDAFIGFGGGYDVIIVAGAFSRQNLVWACSVATSCPIEHAQYD